MSTMSTAPANDKMSPDEVHNDETGPAEPPLNVDPQTDLSQQLFLLNLTSHTGSERDLGSATRVLTFRNLFMHDITEDTMV